MASERQTKKAERPGLTQDEVSELRQVFSIFDTNGTGKIEPKEIKAYMQSLGYDSKNPTMFQLIEDLDNSEYDKTKSIKIYKLTKKNETFKSLINVYLINKARSLLINNHDLQTKYKDRN